MTPAFTRILRRALARPTSIARSARGRRPRLNLQNLEDRTTPTTFTVNNILDDGSPGSLRWAIGEANNADGADDIVFDAAVFATPQSIAALTPLQQFTNGDLTISNSTGAANVTVTRDGGAYYDFGIFSVDASSPNVTIDGITISGGTAGFGSAIANSQSSNLTIKNSVVTNNTGGVGTISMPPDATGMLTVQDTTISGNTGVTGGIYFFRSGSLLVQNSTISGNVGTGYAFYQGGGIVFYGTVGAGGVTIENSTIVDNSSPSYAGGAGLNLTLVTGNVTIRNSTITGNTAYLYAFGGGGVSVIYGAVNVNMTSSIIAQNNGPANYPDVQAYTGGYGGSLITATNCLIGVGPTSDFIDNGGNLLGSVGTPLDPQLGALANNGGFTETRLPLAGSPVIDAGSNPGDLTSDQRGFGYVRSYNGTADMGAVEVQPPGLPVAVSSPTDITDANIGETTYTFTVLLADPTGTNNGINVATVVGNNAAIRVTGPGGFDAPATFVSINNATNGTPRTATYSITPPGGAWDQDDVSKSYLVVVQGNQIADLDGNFISAGAVGKFKVGISHTFVVTNADDSGTGSLRDAIDQANFFFPSDNITFDPLFFSTPQNIALASTLPQFASDGGEVVVVGPGADILSVDGGGAVRVFDSVAPKLTMSGMTVTGGLADNSANLPNGEFGGGLRATGTVILDRMVFSGNNAIGNYYFDAGSGGAIGMASGGFLMITNSTISGNTADGKGAGVFFRYGGALVIENSTISGNSTAPTGAAYGLYGGSGVFFLFRASAGTPAGFIPNTMLIKNSTIANNTTTGSGGGVAGLLFGGTLLIQNSTISGNNADGVGSSFFGTPNGGGGISMQASYNGRITLQNSIVSGNTNGFAPDIQSPYIVNAYSSLIGSGSGFNLSAASTDSIVGAEAFLGPLQDNGGTTQTMLPLPGSPAINAGSNALIPPGITTDQRGAGFTRTFDGTVDMGAIEDQPIGEGPFVRATTPPVNIGDTLYTFTVKYADPNGTNNGIDVSTIIDNDDAVRVVGPDGYDVAAKFVSIDDGTNGEPRVATYSIVPPGGSWTGSDSGLYIVNMQANQVVDLDGNFAPEGQIGALAIDAPQTVVVTNANDDGAGSLRAAMERVAKTRSDDVIVFDPGFFNTHRDITLATALPHIPFGGGGLTITGPGVAKLTVNGGGLFRVLDSDSPALNLFGFTVTGGLADGSANLPNGEFGGGLRASGIVKLDHMAFRENTAIGSTYFDVGAGGGIGMKPGSSLMIQNSTIANNTAEQKGGGIFFRNGGALVIENSTISGNSSAPQAPFAGYYGGGGIMFLGNTAYSPPPGFTANSVVILNSTIANNSTTGSGGGINGFFFGGSLVIQNSTITGNNADASGDTGYPFYTPYGGGGISFEVSYNGTIVLQNSIVSGNTNADRPDMSNRYTYTYAYYSLIGSTNGITLAPSSAGNLIGVDPLLGPLQNNGGPTETMKPLIGSPIIDVGSNSYIPAGVTTDQRGGSHVRIFGAGVDMGAVEFQPPGVTIDQATTQADPTNVAPITFDVVFEQDVTGFDAADIDLSASTVGGTLVANVTGTGAVYTVTVTGMTGQGDVIASIPAGSAIGIDGANLASDSTDNTVHFDAVSPTVTINQGSTQADPTQGATVLFDVLFDEPVTGFDADDISFAGSTVGGTLVATVTGSGANYVVSVTGMTGQGTVVASIPAAAAVDLVGNTSVASTSTDNSVTFDSVAPTVTINQAIGQADPTGLSPIAFTVVFNEPVTGFDGSDISFAGSTVGGILVASVTGSGATYTVNVTGMTGEGTVVASIPAGAAADLAGNLSLDSTSTDNTVIFDGVVPTVTINQAVGQSDPTNTPSIKFDVKFSEAVTGFNSSGVSLAGTTAAGTLTVTVTGSLDTYSVTVTGLTTRGFVVASILAGAANDAVGNANTASTSTDNSVEFLNTGTLGFSQAVFNTTEDATAHTATITVTRAGQTERAVSIDYATTAGTAHAGTDYTTTFGTVSWADGEGGDKTFTVTILPDTINEGKELFNLTLVNPVGSPGIGLLTAIGAIARSDGQAPGKYLDQDGDKFTIALGGKTGSLLFFRTDPDGDGRGPIDSIQLIGTLPDPLKPKATLSINVTKAKTSTDGGTVQLGGIDGSGLKSIAARKANLNGDGIILTGYLASLTIGNISNGADITTLATTNIKQTTKINALTIGDGTAIDVGAPIANLTAKRIGVGTIVAPSITTMNVPGQGNPTIFGDMASDITLSGAGVAAGKSALGSLTVAGSIPSGADIVAPSVGKILVKKDMAGDVTISGVGVDPTKNALNSLTVKGFVTGSDIFVKGNVGTVTVGAFRDSRLFAGYTGADNGTGTFNFPATVTKFVSTGKIDGFQNSRVIATNFKTVTITNVDSTNSANKFGFYADTSLGTKLGSITVKTPTPLFKYNPALPTPQGFGDFEVRIV